MQTEWTPTAEPSEKDWMRFRVSPRDEGQIVEHSYAIDLADGVLWRRTLDRSEGARAVPEYATRPLTDREIERETTAERES